MKILFVHFNDYLHIGIPTGIACLSAVLRQNGHEIGLFDSTFIKTKRTSKSSTTGPSTFKATEYTLEDLTEKDPVTSIENEFRKKLEVFSPDLVAVSVMTSYFDQVIDLLKAVPPKCATIFGGVHPTISPELTLAKKEVDFICIGEGEELMLELVNAIQNNKAYSGIKNLGYKNEGKITLNPQRPFIDMNKIPTPDWSLFDDRHLFRPYLGKIYKGSFIIQSRGCPAKCTYCVNSALKSAQKDCGRYYRVQLPATTILHLKTLKKKYGATWFKFADDSLMINRLSHLEELAEGLEPLDIKFGCSIRPESVREEKIIQLKKMGMVAASVGIESGNENIRRDILGRKGSNDTIKKAIKLLNKYDIRVSTFNMIGLPGETRNNVFETIQLNKDLHVEANNVYIVYPYPGTPLSMQNKIVHYDQEGRLIPVSQASNFELSTMPKKEVEGLLKTFELYVRLPKNMWPIVKLAEENNSTARKLHTELQRFLQIGC